MTSLSSFDWPVVEGVLVIVTKVKVLILLVTLLVDEVLLNVVIDELVVVVTIPVDEDVVLDTEVTVEVEDVVFDTEATVEVEDVVLDTEATVEVEDVVLDTEATVEVEEDNVLDTEVVEVGSELDVVVGVISVITTSSKLKPYNRGWFWWFAKTPRFSDVVKLIPCEEWSSFFKTVYTKTSLNIK